MKSSYAGDAGRFDGRQEEVALLVIDRARFGVVCDRRSSRVHPAFGSVPVGTCSFAQRSDQPLGSQLGPGTPAWAT